MQEAVQASCPQCRKSLRIPPELVGTPIRCKHCGTTFQLKKRATPAGAAPAADTPPQAKQPKSSTPAAPAPPPLFPPPVPPLRAATPLPPFDPAPAISPLPPHHPTAWPVGAVPVAVPPYSSAPRPVVPAPIVEELPEAAPGGYNPAFERASSRHTGRGSYKRPKGTPWGTYAALAIVLSVAITGVIIVLTKPSWIFQGTGIENGDTTGDVADNRDSKNGQQGTGSTGGSGGDKPGLRPDAAVSGPFPRRMLAIAVTNYLYANGITYGLSTPEVENQRRDFYKIMDKLATGWKIPKDQVYYITDGPQQDRRIDGKHPPLKPVISETITRFCESSRPQDRIVLVFAGHAMEKDGEAYLVPQEGDLEEVPTLIPLKEVYAKLAACPAQEKLVIFDVCRLDPGRGTERPSFGAMTPELETALHNSPDGVSVWTSCSKGEYSYESDYYQVDLSGLRKFEIYGSVFLNVLFADSKGAMTKSASGKGIQSPAEPLPVQALAEYVQEYTTKAVQDLEKQPQTPKLTYKYTGDKVAYDPKEPLAAKIQLYPAPATADQKEIASIFDELRLPSIKAMRKDVQEVKLSAVFPFNAETLMEYKSDGVSEEDIRKMPEKYPLRMAVLSARDAMREMRQEGTADELPEEFRGQTGDQAKAKILAIQRIPAKREFILAQIREQLEEAGKHREMEKSKRWLAHYDYMLAQIKARQVYISQYNLMLGKVRKDELPELDPKLEQTGWKLAAGEVSTPADMKALAKDVKNELDSVIKEYPGTPWALQAKRERGLALGLKWQAASFK